MRFCKGRGTDPYDQLSSLSTCGLLRWHGDEIGLDASCQLRVLSWNRELQDFRCPICGGAGVMPALDDATETCPECEGMACEASSGFPCLLLPRPRNGCRGKRRDTTPTTKGIDMTIKTAHDLKSSLLGSAFRRISIDGCTIDLRRIMTVREWMACHAPSPKSR